MPCACACNDVRLCPKDGPGLEDKAAAFAIAPFNSRFLMANLTATLIAEYVQMKLQIDAQSKCVEENGKEARRAVGRTLHL